MASATATVEEVCAAARARGARARDARHRRQGRRARGIAAALEARRAEILEANRADVEAGREAGLSAALLDRLALDERRIAAMAAGVRAIAALPDPVGEVVDGFRRAQRPRDPQGARPARRRRRRLRGAPERDDRRRGAVR